MLNNQGLVKEHFRAGLGLIRLAESSFTAVAYYVAGMFTAQSVGLVPYIVPSLILGVPLGSWIIRHVRPETFRRVCMSFDAWVVGFGISTLLQQLRLVETGAAYSVLAAVSLLDTWLLYRFFHYGPPRALAASGSLPLDAGPRVAGRAQRQDERAIVTSQSYQVRTTSMPPGTSG